jgi:ribonuclease HI
MSKIIIYTDGGVRGNGKANNIGGWGVILQHQGNKVELYGGEINTTNNRMELTACIKALEYIKSNKVIPVEIYTDSAYVVNGMNDWIFGWIKNGWKNSKKKPVENKELWEKLHSLSMSMGRVEFIKVKGHADNEGNNRADKLVNKAMDELEIKLGLR